MSFEPHLGLKRFTAPEPPKSVDVTAVVVTHNSGRHLAALVQSLTSGSCFPTRLIAIDNESTDDTVAKAEGAGLETIRAGSNRGFGAGCNVGLSEASTEFVLFCNPDVRPASTALESLLSALQDAPTAAIAGPAFSKPAKARRFSRLSANIIGFLPRPLQPSGGRLKCEVTIAPYAKAVVVDYVVGAFMLCRTAALRSVSGFDEAFFLYSEEEDLARRLQSKGWQTLLVPAATADHDESTSSDGVGKASMSAFRFHSLYWYYRKYHRREYAEFARAAIALCVTLDRAYRALAGQHQTYGRLTSLALFRTTTWLRRAHEEGRL